MGREPGWGGQFHRDAYRKVKDIVTTGPRRFVERHRPGFRALIDYTELATPLTVRSMMGHRQGGIYSHPATPRRFDSGAFPARTSAVTNLYLTGCDVGCLGINGSMMGGVMTASLLLGSAGYPRVLAASRKRRPPDPAPARSPEPVATSLGSAAPS